MRLVEMRCNVNRLPAGLLPQPEIRGCLMCDHTMQQIVQVGGAVVPAGRRLWHGVGFDMSYGRGGRHCWGGLGGGWPRVAPVQPHRCVGCAGGVGTHTYAM